MGGGTRLLVPIKSYLHRRGTASPLGSRRHVNLISSPSRTGLYVQPIKRTKSVRWHETIHARVKPTTSNLRPLERLSRRQLKDGDCDPWDQQWRLYLSRYYSEDMELCPNLTVEDLEDIEACRRLLDLYSQEANNRISIQLPCSNNLEVPTGARTPSGLSTTEVNVFRLSRREKVHHAVMRTLIDLMLAWTTVEKWRWPQTSFRGSGIILELPLVTTTAERQSLFLDFVERIEAYQRKYKSVGDGVKRLKKKVVRSWQMPEGGQMTTYGDATPHPSAFGVRAID